MDSNSAFWAMIGAVSMALINSTASVLMLWIRARYQYHESSNGTQSTTSVQSPH